MPYINENSKLYSRLRQSHISCYINFCDTNRTRARRFLILIEAMETPKYQLLFDSLKGDILAGRYRPGQKLPSEASLVTRSHVSRITVTRALRELQNARLVERVAGSGTYVPGGDALENTAYPVWLAHP